MKLILDSRNAVGCIQSQRGPVIDNVNAVNHWQRVITGKPDNVGERGL